MRKTLLAAVILALTGCGLENFPYLVPPGCPDPADTGTPIFQLQNQRTTVLEFNGFELYYRFFNTELEIQTGYSTLNQLTANGYSRMCSEGTLSSQIRPLITVDPLDQDTVFLIILDFSNVENAAPVADYQGANPPAVNPIPIRRSAVDIDQTKTFRQDDLDEGDSDLSTVTYPGGGDSLYLVVYALSYGLYEYTPIYSDAVYLGYMDYNF
ncbi:MAG: hypothetical protein A2177_09265 [Spirochaetes bacterium RBG_13_68_11]|nr:MAG: hypothetical protein A2177_09265 [Spirochaetes bacterium RBG_13_68_11]